MSKIYNYFLAFNTYFEDSVKAKLHWLFLLRWFMIIFVLTISTVGLFKLIISSQIFVFIVGLLSLLFLINVLTFFVWIRSKQKLNEVVLAFQLTFDLLILLSLLGISGSLTNPFYILIYFNIAVGVFFLTGWRTWLFVFLGHQVLIVLQILTIKLQSYSPVEIIIPSEHAFIIQHIVMFITFILCYFLAHFIEELQKKVINLIKIQAQQDRLKTLGALLAGFSHELATPLNTIKLRVERELRKNPDSDNLIQLQSAALQCENIIFQINQSQLDHRQQYHQVFNLFKFIKLTTDLWGQENKIDSNLFFNLNFDEKIKTIDVRLSQVGLTQSLFNLFDNAYEANSQTKIIIYVFIDNKKLNIKVKNLNSQVSQTVLDHFGEPFNTNKENGVGLGLYSILLYCEAIGGNFDVLNTNNDVEFLMSFPENVIMSTF